MNRMEIVLKLSKKDVLAEVVQVVEYVGAKMADDPLAYRRMSLQEEDRPIIETYWRESIAEAAVRLRRALVRTELTDEYYEMVFEVDRDGFNDALLPSIRMNLFSFVVNRIVSKWNMVTNKGEVEAYAMVAEDCLSKVMDGVFYRKPPLERRVFPL